MTESKKENTRETRTEVKLREDESLYTVRLCPPRSRGEQRQKKIRESFRRKKKPPELGTGHEIGEIPRNL